MADAMLSEELEMIAGGFSVWPTWCGMPVYVSQMCVKQVRIKVHKKRRSQSEVYHRRVDKKWKKRYGHTAVEESYQLSGAFFGKPHHDRVLVVGPKTFDELKRTMQDSAKELVSRRIEDVGRYDRYGLYVTGNPSLGIIGLTMS